MTVAFVAPLRAMLRSSGAPILWHPLPEAQGAGSSPSGGSGTSPSSLPGLSGWWDASSVAGLLDENGNPLIGWGLAASAARDLSGNDRSLLPYRYSGSYTTRPVAAPRISGTLGGYGYDLQTGPYYPTLDFDLGFQVPNVAMSAEAEWTRALVWSRPNWKQNPYAADSSPNALIYAGATGVVAVDGTGGAGNLILFPGSAASISIPAQMTRRHTHAITLRNVPGKGLDVWLDQKLLASGIENPLAVQGSSPLLLLHSGDGYTTAGGQCWFHELALWERALSDAEVALLTLYFSRWALGPRRAVSFMFNGQSNARNAVEAAGADLTLAQGVAWHLGAIAYGRASKTQNGGPGSMVPGMGIYCYPESASPAYAGTFLQDPLDGSDPSTWELGAMGEEVQAWIESVSPEDRQDIGALVLWWSETDSYRPYSDKARFTSAARRWISLFRGMFSGASAQTLPVVWWNAIPFGNTDGIQMHREVVGSLCADPAMNVVMGNPMTADSNNLDNGALIYDPTTGIQSGGDNQHRDLPDLTIFARRAAPVVSRALLSSGRSDAFGAIPAGLPSVGGPRIVHAFRQTDSSIVLTIKHDAGDDLRIPLQAAKGAGFLVMDGGSVSSPGTLVPATSCSRIDATHLLIALTGTLTNPSANCLLFYPYGSYSPSGALSYTADLGRGNAVTDNFSAVAKPAGWDIAEDLGSAWGIDYPLAATTVPIVLADTP